MEKDIQLLKKLRRQFTKNMVIESKKPLLNINTINEYGEYIKALSNAIQIMKETNNDT